MLLFVFMDRKDILSHKIDCLYGLIFRAICDTILILKFVEPIETEYSFDYKPCFLGFKQLAFLRII